MIRVLHQLPAGRQQKVLAIDDLIKSMQVVGCNPITRLLLKWDNVLLSNDIAI